MVYPLRAIGALVFIPCEGSPVCPRVTGTGKTVLAMFLSTWELAAKAAEGSCCFLDTLLWSK